MKFRLLWALTLTLLSANLFALGAGTAGQRGGGGGGASGAASGDLSGSYPSPLVSSIASSNEYSNIPLFDGTHTGSLPIANGGTGQTTIAKARYALQTAKQLTANPDTYTFDSRSASVTKAWRAIEYSPELKLFVAGGDGAATDVIMTSDNGVKWTTRTQSTTMSPWNVHWVSAVNKFYSCDNGGFLAWSTDGVTFNTDDPNNPGNTIAIPEGSDIAYSEALGLYVIAGGNGNNTLGSSKIMVSNDGIAFSNLGLDNSTLPYRTQFNGVVASGSSGFAALGSVASSNNTIYYSADGTNWSQIAPPEDNYWHSIAYSPELGVTVAVATAGTHRVMYSTDLLSWQTATAAEQNSWWTVRWSAANHLFYSVAISGTNRIMTSPDGITWTARAAPAANQWSTITSNELGLVVGASFDGTDRMMTSGAPNLLAAVPTTITATGSTGAKTINKPTGSVNIAAGQSSITVTNSIAGAKSIIFATIATNDSTALIKNVVASAGSFVITLNAAATAETRINWFVVN